MTPDIYLLLGTNEGDRLYNLSLARTFIDLKAGTITATSGIYETAPWGKTDQAAFLNQAICISSDYDPQTLLNIIKQIETQVGRVISEKWGPRVIDIDILLYSDNIINLPDLIIPHPFLPDRRFALIPLLQISKDIVHPTLKCSISEMLANCMDNSQVVIH
jgi:2-amino-4-hydroxy-6-hydroxymethyldihydropteridine diphosphokinase